MLEIDGVRIIESDGTVSYQSRSVSLLGGPVLRSEVLIDLRKTAAPSKSSTSRKTRRKRAPRTI